MLDDEAKREVRAIIRDEIRKLFAQSDAVSKSVKQRHLEGNVIFFGLAANRPSGSTEVKCYFSTNSDTLNIWNGSAWVQEILT